MNGSSEAHTKLVDDVHLAIGSLAFARIWKNATGAARSFDNPDRVVSFGLKGSSDLVGVLKGGKILCIECKTGNATQSKDQKNFEAMIKLFGGYYFVVKTVEDAIELVNEAGRFCKTGEK